METSSRYHSDWMLPNGFMNDMFIQGVIIMPLYSYVCKNCGEIFDLLVGVTARKTEMKCAKCGSENIEKRISTFSLGESGKSSSGSDSSCPTGTCPLG
jgi:putative FmdB family regulatory protein